jgi:nitrite reductase/ring-hydroxylating ferredoxin subunit
MSVSGADQCFQGDGESRDGAKSAPVDERAVAAGGPVTSQCAAPVPKWQEVCSLEAIPDGDILARQLGGHDLVVYRNGTHVSCLPNYCPHRGWPFDGGRVRDGVLECPFHGYEFRLDTGECLTSSYCSLEPHPIRIRDGRVDVLLK